MSMHSNLSLQQIIDALGGSLSHHKDNADLIISRVGSLALATTGAISFLMTQNIRVNSKQLMQVQLF
jgi:hypothetical protein